MYYTIRLSITGTQTDKPTSNQQMATERSTPEPTKNDANRLLRERNLLRSLVNSLQLEHEDLTQRLQAATEAHETERSNEIEKQNAHYRRTVDLEKYNNEMLTEKAMLIKTNEHLREKLNLLHEQLRDAHNDISKLRTSLNQYK